MPNNNHLKQVWATVFTKEAPLDFDTPLGLMVHKLIVDHLSSWRHNIGSVGLLALQFKVFSTLQGSDVVKARSEWCTWAVSCTEGDHPFYFASIIEDSDGNVQSQSGIFQSKLISAILGTYINGIMPLHLNIKTDRPVSALVMAVQSVRIYVFFFCVATTRLFSDFSKANWGDHNKTNANGFPIPVYPTHTLVELINQLKPKQWENILATAIEDSRVSLAAEAFQHTSASSAILASQGLPKLELRDDDSDIDMD
ncbi:hypothetical protein EI94DRAFT_1732997 [Lactarius quietus]|nr:hypothetical protein EI94DRAFT_1732997 [Lactarius quietus]